MALQDNLLLGGGGTKPRRLLPSGVGSHVVWQTTYESFGRNCGYCFRCTRARLTIAHCEDGGNRFVGNVDACLLNVVTSYLLVPPLSLCSSRLRPDSKRINL
jgi:hypothetical protein